MTETAIAAVAAAAVAHTPFCLRECVATSTFVMLLLTSDIILLPTTLIKILVACGTYDSQMICLTKTIQKFICDDNVKIMCYVYIIIYVWYICMSGGEEMVMEMEKINIDAYKSTAFMNRNYGLNIMDSVFMANAI